MQSKEHNKLLNQLKLRLFLLIMLICVIPTLCFSIEMDQEFSFYKKTETVRTNLTIAHGDIVKKVITDFETTWSSLEMHKKPELFLNKLVTGPLYSYYLKHPLYQDQSHFLISRLISVSKIKVLAFSGNVFKAIACKNWEYEEVDVNGKLLKQYGPMEHSKFYTFINENGNWKLGISIDTSWPDGGRQEWEYLPEEIKNYIGEFDPNISIDCASNSD